MKRLNYNLKYQYHLLHVIILCFLKIVLVLVVFHLEVLCVNDIYALIFSFAGSS